MTSRNRQSSEVRGSGEGREERLTFAIGDWDTFGLVKMEMFPPAR